MISEAAKGLAALPVNEFFGIGRDGFLSRPCGEFNEQGSGQNMDA
jgi:hypothetical protein